jgi:hypothetical protein
MFGCRNRISAHRPQFGAIFEEHAAVIIETHARATLLPCPYCPGSGTGIKKFPVSRPWATLAVSLAPSAKVDFDYSLSGGLSEGRSLI